MFRGVLCVAAALLVASPIVHAAPPRQHAGASPHLKISTFYGFDPDHQHEWMNMGLEASLQDKLDAWHKYKMPSFYGGLPAAPADNAIFIRGKGVAPGWEEHLEALAKSEILPNMATGAIRGVFLGDEICCHNISCWSTALEPVTNKLRELLGEKALIYTNECANSGIASIPPAFDLISVDVYAGYEPPGNGTAEVVAAKKMYEQVIFPKLHPHQQVLLVPGVFACSNLSYFSLDQQAETLVEKLDGYFAWAKAEPKIAGFNPWHWHNRSSPQHGPPCDMRLGGIAMPTVVEKVKEIGSYIVNQQRQMQ